MTVDISNMGRIEGMFYEQLEAIDVKIAGHLRRYATPLPMPSGATKEWLVELTYPDNSVKTINVPYDLEAYAKVAKFARGEI